MAIVPGKLQDFLDWADLHASIWQASPTSLGLTAADATAFVNAATLARTRYNEQIAARQRSKRATELQQDAVRDARRLASDLIGDIRDYAEVQPKPAEVYSAAGLPVPGTAAPLPPPGKPNSVTVGIEPASGAITLKWKAANPVGASGTTYIVRRRNGATGEYVFVGVSGVRNFTDNTFVAGPDSVQYVIQGQRGASAGPSSDPITINFGRQGPGRTSTSMTVEGGTLENKQEAA